MQAVRRGRARSTLLYNTIGKAQWEVLQLDASVAAGGGLARRVSLLDQQARAQPQLRAGAHGMHGAPAGGPARHMSFPEHQTGPQLGQGVHVVHAAPEVVEVRHQSLTDQQAGEQLRTGEIGDAASVEAGHASVLGRQAGLQPHGNEGSMHKASIRLHAEGQLRTDLQGIDAIGSAGPDNRHANSDSAGESRSIYTFGCYMSCMRWRSAAAGQ